MRYDTKIEKVVIGHGSRAMEFQIEVIADFNQAIDDMFAELQSRGEQDLLTDLCPYFGTVWDSARALSSQLAAEPQSNVMGQSFLEIGCGLAIPSMVLLKLDAGKVIATDLHPDVPWFLERNFAANHLSGHPAFSYRSLDWRTRSSEVLAERPQWILASDVLYDRGQAEAVAGFLAEAFAAGASRATITDPGRPYLQDFVSACDRLGLQSSVEIFRTDSADSRRDCFVLRIVQGKGMGRTKGSGGA
jgi:predicted nicotinamide N-methyase